MEELMFQKMDSEISADYGYGLGGLSVYNEDTKSSEVFNGKLICVETRTPEEIEQNRKEREEHEKRGFVSELFYELLDHEWELRGGEEYGRHG